MTILILNFMGGNNSYSKGWGGVLSASRTHIYSDYKVCGHKVVFSASKAQQRKNILNSNSSNAAYLIATKDKDGILTIHSVNVFKAHELVYEINLEFNAKGDIIPFDGISKGSHAHYWRRDGTGRLLRQSHDRKNTFAIADNYHNLVNEIVKFNKKHRKYGKNNQNT